MVRTPTGAAYIRNVIEHLGHGFYLFNTSKLAFCHAIPSCSVRGLHQSHTMSLFDFHSSTLLYRVISIICQTLVYGQSPLLVSVPFSPPRDTDLPIRGTKGYIRVSSPSRFMSCGMDPSV